MYVRFVCRGLAALALCCLFTLPAAAKTERALGTVTVPINIGSMTHDVTAPTPAVTVTISPAPASDVTLEISLGGTVGHEASILTTGLTFTPTVTTRTFQVTSGTNLGTITLNFSLTGTNAGEYTLSKTSHSFPVIARFSVSPIVGQNSTMVAGESRTYTLTPSKPVPSGITLSMLLDGTAGYTVTPSSVLTFPAGLAAQQFTIQTTSPGTITLGWVRSGPDAATFGPPPPFNITVTAPNTPAGENVSVTPTPIASVSMPVTVTFGRVTSAGTTRLNGATLSPQAATPPTGFEWAGSPLYFVASTTAVVEAPVHVCPTYPAGLATDETSLRIFKRIGTSWVDVTVSNDTGTNVICAGVPSLEVSLFGIFRLNAAPVVAAITGPAGIVTTGVATPFSATFTDANAADTHTGVFVWATGTAPATITNVGGVRTATAEITFATSATHQLYLVIDDGGQQAFSPTLDVVVDAGPPVIDSVTATPGNIWPPDSKLHDVAVTVAATDDSGPPVCTITGVSMPGITAGDYAITGALTVKLKAFPHRSYEITVTCTDAVNRTATKTVVVSIERQ